MSLKCTDQEISKTNWDSKLHLQDKHSLTCKGYETEKFSTKMENNIVWYNWNLHSTNYANK